MTLWNFTIIHSKASDINKLAIELKAKVSEVNKLLVNLRAQKGNGEVESCTCAFSVSSETNNKGETTQKKKKIKNCKRKQNQRYKEKRLSHTSSTSVTHPMNNFQVNKFTADKSASEITFSNT